MTTFSFDPQCPSNLSPKYIDALSKIDATIDELAIRNDMTPNNEKVLTTITRKLHNDLLTHLERSRLVIDLQKSVEQVLSFTDIPDQILTKCEALSKRFPEEFHNVTYDFTNIKSFKLPALEDAKGALTNLKNHGYRQEAEPILNLLELIFLHYNLYQGVEELNSAISKMIVDERRKKDPNCLTKENFEDLRFQLQDAKKEASIYAQKWKKNKEKYHTQKQTNERLKMNLVSLRDEIEYRQKLYDIEIERREKELKQLRNVAHEHSMKLREVQALYSQIQSEKEKYNILEAKYQKLMIDHERLSAQLSK